MAGASSRRGAPCTRMCVTVGARSWPTSVCCTAVPLTLALSSSRDGPPRVAQGLRSLRTVGLAPCADTSTGSRSTPTAHDHLGVLTTGWLLTRLGGSRKRGDSDRGRQGQGGEDPAPSLPYHPPRPTGVRRAASRAQGPPGPGSIGAASCRRAGATAPRRRDGEPRRSYAGWADSRAGPRRP